MYKRVIIKLSGEALKGDGTYGIHPLTVKKNRNRNKRHSRAWRRCGNCCWRG